MTRDAPASTAGAALEQIVVATAAFWTLSASARFLSAAAPSAVRSGDDRRFRAAGNVG